MSVEQRSEKPRATRKVRCEFCDRLFVSNHGLKIHCARKHQREMEIAKANIAAYHGDIDGDFNYW